MKPFHSHWHCLSPRCQDLPYPASTGLGSVPSPRDPCLGNQANCHTASAERRAFSRRFGRIFRCYLWKMWKNPGQLGLPGASSFCLRLSWCWTNQLKSMGYEYGGMESDRKASEERILLRNGGALGDYWFRWREDPRLRAHTAVLTRRSRCGLWRGILRFEGSIRVILSPSVPCPHGRTG